MNAIARLAVLPLLLLLSVPLYAHDPAADVVSLQEEVVLPSFGDPRFPALPLEPGDFLLVETDDEDPINWSWFDGGSVPQSGEATGHIRLAYRRGDQAFQAVAHAFTYSRSSSTADATETIRLSGDVILVNPDGSLGSERLTVTIARDNYQVEALGGLVARFHNQQLQATTAHFDLEGQRGDLEGDVRLSLNMEGDAEHPAPELPERLRPILSGVDLEPKAVTITGHRFDIAFDDHGIRDITSPQPVEVTLFATEIPEVPAAQGSTGGAVREVTITCEGFEALFSPLPNGGSALGSFNAPGGIRIAYEAGVLEAGTGAVDLENRELTFGGQVRVEQEGTTGVAQELQLKYTDAGQIQLTATGRPTFTFSTSEFRPLADILNSLRPDDSLAPEIRS